MLKVLESLAVLMSIPVQLKPHQHQNHKDLSSKVDISKDIHRVDSNKKFINSLVNGVVIRYFMILLISLVQIFPTFAHRQPRLILPNYICVLFIRSQSAVSLDNAFNPHSALKNTVFV